MNKTQEMATDKCCAFVDIIANKELACNKNKCKYSTFCELHTMLEEIKIWKNAKMFHEQYEYVGSHWEKADEYGVEDIYHYIRRNKNDDERIVAHDYDVEIWIQNPIWKYCGSRYKSLLEHSEFNK